MNLIKHCPNDDCAMIQEDWGLGMVFRCPCCDFQESMDWSHTKIPMDRAQVNEKP
jgi:hypothetical protein